MQISNNMFKTPDCLFSNGTNHSLSKISIIAPGNIVAGCIADIENDEYKHEKWDTTKEQ